MLGTRFHVVSKREFLSIDFVVSLLYLYSVEQFRACEVMQLSQSWHPLLFSDFFCLFPDG